MSDYTSISFEFAKKFGYKGLNNDQIKPEYASFNIDFVKLLDFLNQKDSKYYDAIMFKSDNYFHQFISYGMEVEISGYLDVYPNVLINNEQTKLLIGAKLNSKSGKVNLSRNYNFGFEINPSESIEKYKVKIPYEDIEKPNKDEDFAIILYSEDFDHIIYVIEQIHHVFDQKLEDWLYERVSEKFESSGIKNNKDRLDFMYEQIPLWIIARRNNDSVFQDLITILKGSVNSYGTNEELAVIRIIKSFATPPTFVGNDASHKIDINQNSNFLLRKSISEKVNGELVFHRLYNVMHDYGGEDNFSMFLQLFYLFWLESEYKVRDYTGTGQPIILDYKSNKILGFYSDNKNFSFKNESVIVSKTVHSYMDTGTAFIDNSYEETLAELHIFQPINIPEVQQDGELKFLSNVIPAFYLKAFADKNAYANLEKAIWLVVDIVTTFTGVGNLLKLRHLATVVKGLKVLKITIAGIEVVSGTIGLMLNFVDECDNPNDNSFCNKLRTFLIYVDLATLGLDALTSKFIRNAAKDALDNMPAALRKQHPEIADELLTIARDGKLTEESIQAIRKFLKQKGYNAKFNLVTIDLYESSGKFYFRLDKAEVEVYFNFISQAKTTVRKQLKNVNKELGSNTNKYNPSSKTSKKYNVPSSKPNKLCQNFKGTKYIHSEKANFKIRLTGSRNKDFEECRRIYSEKVGLTYDDILDLEDELYVWHHLDDLDENLNCTMQLVRKSAHKPSHIGSVKQFEILTGIKYK